MNTIDLGRAVRAPFADPAWVNKTLLGLVWTLLVVTAPAVLGAQVEYIRRCAVGNEELPDWNDFGDKWVTGLLVAAAGFIYFLPVVVAAIAVLLPVSVVAVAGDERAIPFSVLVVGLVAAGAMIYALAVTIFFYAALTHYALTRRFGAFFEFGEIATRIRAGNYFSAWFFAWVISIVAGIASSALTGTWVLSLITPAISYLAAMMTGHVLGQYAWQAYRAGQPTA